MTSWSSAEVADRLVAGPGEPAYGAVSVKVAYWAEARRRSARPASVFVPQPQGGFRPGRPAPAPAAGRRPGHWSPPSSCSRVVRAGFAQRRKMLRRALAGTEVDPEAFRQRRASTRRPGPSSFGDRLGAAGRRRGQPGHRGRRRAH